MDLKQLWMKRLKSYHKRMLRYSRFVFNDHLMLIWIFLLGFLAVQYATFINQLGEIPNSYLVIIAAILSIIPFIGQLVSLIEKPDGYFLNMLAKEWKEYFLYSLLYSFWLPIIVILITILSFYPILIKSSGMNNSKIVILCLNVSALKMIDFEKQLFSLATGKIKHIIMFIVQNVVHFSIIIISIFADVRGALILLVLLVIVAVCLLLYWYNQPQLFDWMLLVTKEEARQAKWYRLIELFVDTHYQKKAQIRSTFLSNLKQQYLSDEAPSAINYLITHTLTRTVTYQQFFIKFTAMVLFFSLGISSGELYIVFLLVSLTIEAIYLRSLANYHNKHTLTKVFQLLDSDAKQDVTRIIIKCLLVQELIFLLPLIRYQFKIIFILYLVLMNIYLVLFVKYFIFKRNNRKNKKISL